MKFLLFSACLLIFSSCQPSIKPEQLYGDWKYIRVVKPNLARPDTLSMDELELQNPSIHFTRQNRLYIVWGGEKFSEGTFKIDGSDIQYTEKLPEGKTRTFPFKVSKFENNEMVFETTGAEPTRITAKKIK